MKTLRVFLNWFGSLFKKKSEPVMGPCPMCDILVTTTNQIIGEREIVIRNLETQGIELTVAIDGLDKRIEMLMIENQILKNQPMGFTTKQLN